MKPILLILIILATVSACGAEMMTVPIDFASSWNIPVTLPVIPLEVSSVSIHATGSYLESVYDCVWDGLYEPQHYQEAVTTSFYFAVSGHDDMGVTFVPAIGDFDRTISWESDQWNQILAGPFEMDVFTHEYIELLSWECNSRIQDGVAVFSSVDLIIDYTGSVANHGSTWGSVKALYR